MTLPCLHIAYTGDHCIFPSDPDLVVGALASRDLSRVEIDADHYGFPAEKGRDTAVTAIVEWLRR